MILSKIKTFLRVQQSATSRREFNVMDQFPGWKSLGVVTRQNYCSSIKRSCNAISLWLGYHRLLIDPHKSCKLTSVAALLGVLCLHLYFLQKFRHFFPVWLFSPCWPPNHPRNTALGLDSGLVCHVSRGGIGGDGTIEFEMKFQTALGCR